VRKCIGLPNPDGQSTKNHHFSHPKDPAWPAFLTLRAAGLARSIAPPIGRNRYKFSVTIDAARQAVLPSEGVFADDFICEEVS
jgi:hypothetical protein